MDISRQQVRLLILYEWNLGTSATETANKIDKVFGEGTVSYRTVLNWFATFRSGDLSLEDHERTGRPSVQIDDKLCEAVKKNPEATTRELGDMFDCSHGTISHHLHELGYQQVQKKWVPPQ